MIHRISGKIASWCCAGTQLDNLDVIQYGVEVLIETLSKLLALIIIALFAGYLPEMLIVLIVFSTLRFSAGGFHMKSNIGCFLSMVFIISISIVLNEAADRLNFHIPSEALVLVLLVLIGLVFFFAPRATANNPITDSFVRKKKKVDSVLVAAIISLIIWHLPESFQVLAIVPFMCEVVTIIPIVNHISTREEG